MRYLLSLCFCAACVSSFASAGVDVDQLRRDVRDALDGPLRGAETADSTSHSVLGEQMHVVARIRAATADRFRAAVIGRIRDRRPEWRIALHGSPNPEVTTAFTGVDVSGWVGEDHPHPIAGRAGRQLLG